MTPTQKERRETLKGQITQEIEQTGPEYTAERIMELQDGFCACASSKCGPHRCWPSKAAMVLLGLVLTYNIVMMAYWHTERSELKSDMTIQVAAGIAQLQIQVEGGRQADLKMLIKALNALDNRMNAHHPKRRSWFGWLRP